LGNGVLDVLVFGGGAASVARGAATLAGLPRYHS
jgi:hypothetical protein